MVILDNTTVKEPVETSTLSSKVQVIIIEGML